MKINTSLTPTSQPHPLSLSKGEGSPGFFPGKRNRHLSYYIILIASVFAFQVATAQQVPIFSLYNENGYVLNPGITGNEGMGIASVSYRQQWTNINDAPRTFTAGYRMPIYSKGDQFQRAGNFIGVGAYLMNDKTGPTSYLSANASFAYHISFAKLNPFTWAAFLRKSHLSFGLNLSANQYRLNSTDLVPEQANDRLVLAANNSRILPNAGLGLYYYYDKFYLGFSAPQVVPLKLKYDDGEGEAVIKKINHYYIVTGGSIPFGEQHKKGRKPKGYIYKFYLEPMVWFKKVRGAPYQYDIYTRFRHKDFVWFGVGYRSSKTIVMDAGFMIKKQIRFGYAYDMAVSNISSYLGGSHEFMIAYRINSDNRR